MVNMNPINPLNNIDKTANIKQSEDPKKILEVCREFESIFINMMLKQAKGSGQVGGFMEKSYAREIFEEMQDEELSKQMSKGQGIGLAQELYKQLTRNRVVTPRTGTASQSSQE